MGNQEKWIFFEKMLFELKASKSLKDLEKNILRMIREENPNFESNKVILLTSSSGSKIIFRNQRNLESFVERNFLKGVFFFKKFFFYKIKNTTKVSKQFIQLFLHFSKISSFMMMIYSYLVFSIDKIDIRTVVNRVPDFLLTRGSSIFLIRPVVM